MKYILFIICLFVIHTSVFADEVVSGGGGGSCPIGPYPWRGCGASGSSGVITSGGGGGPGGYSGIAPVEYPLQKLLPFSIFTVWNQTKR